MKTKIQRHERDDISDRRLLSVYLSPKRFINSNSTVYAVLYLVIESREWVVPIEIIISRETNESTHRWTYKCQNNLITEYMAHGLMNKTSYKKKQNL